MATDLGKDKATTGTKYEAFLEEQLDRARKRIRVLDVAFAGLVVLVGMLAYGLGMAYLDRALELPAVFRQVAFGCFGVSVLAYLTFTLLLPLYRQVNPYYAARELERTLPGAKNSVINWLDLRDENLSPAIRGAVGRRAAKDMANADLDRAVSPRRVVWVGAGAAALVVVLILLFVQGPGRFWSLMARAFAPFLEGANAQTRLVIVQPEGGNTKVSENQAVAFTVRIDGKTPPESRLRGAVTLAVKEDEEGKVRRYENPPVDFDSTAPMLHLRYAPSGAWTLLPLEPEGGGYWKVTVAADRVQNGFDYRVTGGDAQTPTYRVQVQSTPVVKDIEVTYEYPKFLRASNPPVSHKGNLEGVRGTRATLIVRTNRKLAEGSLEMEIAGDKQTLKGELLAKEPEAIRFKLTLGMSGGYRIHFKAKNGEVYAGPIRYSIDVIPAAEVTFKYRPYLDWQPQTFWVQNLPSLTALRGTEVTLVYHASQPVKDGRLGLQLGTQKKTLKGTTDAKQPEALRFTFVLDQDGRYGLAYTSREGESAADAGPYPIKVLPDDAPRVELTKPGKDIELPANDVLKVEGRASDDFGLKSLVLRMQVVHNDMAHSISALAPKVYRAGTTLKTGAGVYPTELDYKDFVELEKVAGKDKKPFALQEGMVLEYWLEATDNCDYPEAKKNGQVAQSKHWKVTIRKPQKKDEQQRKQEKEQTQKQQKQHEQKQDDRLKQQKQKKEAPKNPNQDQKSGEKNPDNPKEKKKKEQKRKDTTDRLKKELEKKQKEKQGEKGKSKSDGKKKGESKKGPNDSSEKKSKPQADKGESKTAPKDQKDKNGNCKNGKKGEGSGQSKGEGPKDTPNQKNKGESKKPGKKGDNSGQQGSSKGENQTAGGAKDKPKEKANTSKGKGEGEKESGKDKAQAKDQGPKGTMGERKSSADSKGPGKENANAEKKGTPKQGPKDGSQQQPANPKQQEPAAAKGKPEKQAGESASKAGGNKSEQEKSGQPKAGGEPQKEQEDKRGVAKQEKTQPKGNTKSGGKKEKAPKGGAKNEGPKPQSGDGSKGEPKKGTQEKSQPAGNAKGEKANPDKKNGGQENREGKEPTKKDIDKLAEKMKSRDEQARKEAARELARNAKKAKDEKVRQAAENALKNAGKNEKQEAEREKAFQDKINKMSPEEREKFLKKLDEQVQKDRSKMSAEQRNAQDKKLEKEFQEQMKKKSPKEREDFRKFIKEKMTRKSDAEREKAFQEKINQMPPKEREKLLNKLEEQAKKDRSKMSPEERQEQDKKLEQEFKEQMKKKTPREREEFRKFVRGKMKRMSPRERAKLLQEEMKGDPADPKNRLKNQLNLEENLRNKLARMSPEERAKLLKNAGVSDKEWKQWDQEVKNEKRGLNGKPLKGPKGRPKSDRPERVDGAGKGGTISSARGVTPPEYATSMDTYSQLMNSNRKPTPRKP